MKKVSVFITIFLLCIYKAFAATQKTCPAGLFCTNNGKYTPGDTYSHDIQGYQIAPSELVAPGWGAWQEEGLCDDGTPDSVCMYVATDYDEVWVSTWFGFYTIKNGEVTHHSSKTNAIKNVFACPGTYPSSDSGASSVFQCYRNNSNGQKEYYKAPTDETPEYDGNYDTDSVNAILTNLQSAMDQAQVAVSNLQNILKQSNNKINQRIPYNKKIHVNSEAQTNAVNTEKLSVQINTIAPQDTTQTETKTDLNSKDNNKNIEFGSLPSIFTDRSAIPNRRAATRSAINKKIERSAISQPVNNTRPNIDSPKRIRTGSSRGAVTNNRHN